MNALILIPTLNRTGLVKEFIKSYVETKATVPVWFLVDSDDLAKNISAYEEIGSQPNIRVMNTGANITMGDKCRFIWPQVKELNLRWLGLLNDDHYCVTPHWDSLTDKLIDGTNMVSTDDGNWNFGFNVVGLTAWSFPILEACGFPIFPRNMKHYFIDNCWKAIGESSGCWLETNKITIEHRHVFNGKMGQDDTFRLVNDPKKTSYCEKEFQFFMEQDFQEVCVKIMELRKSHIQDQKFV